MPSDAIHSKFVHLADIVQRPRWLTAWERHRHGAAHWFVEMVAEATGVFMFCYIGASSNLAWNIGTLGKQVGVGSLTTVGAAYALGIVFAITTCAPTSGGHFNPAVTLSFVIYKGFPPIKALRYVVAQVLGGYIAFLLLYAQYSDLIHTVEAGLIKAGVYETVNFSAQGMAGVFAFYSTSYLPRVLLNEFVCDFFLGFVIWSSLDPTSFFLTPSVGPFVVALAYSGAIWGFAPVGLAANAARDVAGRLAAMSIWGISASGGKYAALTALTNLPATLAAVAFYEVFFTDSSRVIPSGTREFIEGHRAHMEHSRGVHDHEDLRLPEFNPNSEEKEDE